MPAPKLTCEGVAAPPRLTVKDELLAAKPPLALVAHCTWPAVVPTARVNVPAISRMASVPAVAWLKTRLLLEERLLIDPSVNVVPAATVALVLSRIWVGSRTEAMVAPTGTPVPVTV